MEDEIEIEIEIKNIREEALGKGLSGNEIDAIIEKCKGDIPCIEKAMAALLEQKASVEKFLDKIDQEESSPHPTLY